MWILLTCCCASSFVGNKVCDHSRICSLIALSLRRHKLIMDMKIEFNVTECKGGVKYEMVCGQHRVEVLPMNNCEWIMTWCIFDWFYRECHQTSKWQRMLLHKIY